MLNSLQPYILAFIPLFVAVDAIGNVPLFISLTEGASQKQKVRTIRQSALIATAMAVIFMFVGKWILRMLGVTIPDFQVAGGLLLFVIALRLLLPENPKGPIAASETREMGVFPLGTPLITGPAVLTTTLMLLDTYGLTVTFVAIILNMLVVWITLEKSDVIIKILGSHGTRAFSKIMYILLAAIAVMMVRRGIIGVINL